MSFSGSSKALCELRCLNVAGAVQVSLLWTELRMHRPRFSFLGKRKGASQLLFRRMMRFGVIKWLQASKVTRLQFFCDYKWLRVKMGLFISMTDCLGSAWFMLWITCVFPLLHPSASDNLLQMNLHTFLLADFPHPSRCHCHLLDLHQQIFGLSH